MLPLQITLDGFMSYRDRATLSFEGASLWMLAGNNGAGKSSVFDAMRWILFNRHRGGAQGHEALIHHGKNRLRVAFDIEIAAGRFRLIRTLSRAGKSTWQIEKLGAVSPDDLLEIETEKVPETDMRDGYNRWIDENIGLSDETFGAAFYLAQGRGDAILSANPEQRYEMLAEIVDLSAFQKLYERVKTKAGELSGQSQAKRLQFEAAPAIEAAQIEISRAKWDEISTQCDGLSARLNGLSSLELWSKQWQEWEDLRLETEKTAAEARELLSEAPQIEADAARLSALEMTLPPLENWLSQCARREENEAEIVAAQARLKAAHENSLALTAARDEAKTRRDDLESKQQELEKARLAALLRQNELAPRVAAADALESGCASLARLESQLNDLPADLESQKTALETRIETARASQIALGALRRFERGRGTWHGAAKTLETATKLVCELETSLPKLQIEFEKRAARADELRAAESDAREVVAAARARFSDAQTASQRFDEVKNEPNCHFCGQKLTPQHAAREEIRIRHALQAAETAAETAKTARDVAETAAKAAKTAQDELQNQIEERKTRLQSARNDGHNAQTARDQAAQNAAEALRELEPPFAARFDGEASREWNSARVEATLRAEYPAASDFSALQTEADTLLDAEKCRVNLEKQNAARGKIEAQRDAVQAQIEPLQKLFDDSALLQLRRESDALKLELDAAKSSLEAMETALKDAEKVAKTAESALVNARDETAKLETQIAGFEAARGEIERARREFESSHQELQPLFSRDLAELRADFAAWQAELAQLENGDLRARLERLHLARERVAELELELSRLQNSLQSVPEAARRPPAELSAEIAALRSEIEALDAQSRDAELETTRLQRLFDEKTALQSALLEAETAARQHRTLADLLGPNSLQRFLLREAENGIVDEANAVLDRISSGTLRLDLRADDEEIVGARKGAPKVLDVVVWMDGAAQIAPDELEPTTARAMLPAFLSGSQRFRVAVSLALGIGRFATRGQGHSRLESVIIDEGFGALDKVGRGEMIDELKALGDELKRVILVSHQEEFADAFSNRYLIEHDGVASTARLLVG